MMSFDMVRYDTSYHSPQAFFIGMKKQFQPSREAMADTAG